MLCPEILHKGACLKNMHLLLMQISFCRIQRNMVAARNLGLCFGSMAVMNEQFKLCA
jgi:hypothetical protein